MPTPPPLTATLVDGLLQIRIFVLRHLSLPRSKRSRKEYIAASPSESDEDRYHALRYRAYPWYVKANTSSRFKAWVKGQSPPGPRFQGKGYKILELGPNDMKGKGEDEMAKMAREIRVTRGME